MTQAIQRPATKIIEVKPKAQPKETQPQAQKTQRKPPRPNFEETLSGMVAAYDRALCEAKTLAERHFEQPSEETIRQVAATLLIQSTNRAGVPEVREGSTSTPTLSEVLHD